MMAQVFALPARAITLEVSGNGADSDSTVEVQTEQNTVVSQSNDFSASNDINTNASTGGNSSDRNTGGSASISTGDATTFVGVSNSGNSNEASVDCCAANQDVDVLISGNGAGSDNNVELGNENNVQLFQNNESRIRNEIDNDAKTGHNSADRNTGGDVEITTGNAVALTSILNGGNVNSALVGGGSHSLGSGVSARIIGNGAYSDNDIELGLGHSVALVQNNSARINNSVDTDAKTGGNSADRNTGGDVTIDTGNADVEVLIDNAVNFNWADVDCGCLLDVTAKIAGNGTDSDNDIRAELGDELEVFQDNSCGGYELPHVLLDFQGHFGGYGKDCLNNHVYADAYSGLNTTDSNTGDPGSDPSVSTGDADTAVEVHNAGNSNVYGLSDFEWPNTEGVNVNVTFDLQTLLGLLGLHS